MHQEGSFIQGVLFPLGRPDKGQLVHPPISKLICGHWMKKRPAKRIRSLFLFNKTVPTYLPQVTLAHVMKSWDLFNRSFQGY